MPEFPEVETTRRGLAPHLVGQPCRRCGTPVRQLRLGQRATFYCPHCQT